MSADLDKKRKQLLSYLDEKQEKVMEYQEKLIGPGLLKKIRRLFKFRKKYVDTIIGRLFSNKVKEINILGGRENMLINLNDATTASLYYFGVLGFEQEVRTTKFLVKSLEESSVFYDVGGSYGFYTYLAKYLTTSEEIHYFEPVKNVCDLVRENLNSDVFVNNVAVADQAGEVVFYTKNRASDGSSLINSPDSSSVSVRSITLSDYIETHRKPDYIKLDAEGVEDRIIKGSISFFENNSPVVVMEIHPKSITHKRAERLLFNIGYKKYKIDKNGDLHIWSEKERISKSFDNFIFKK
jgi:FkbM family methyltransferase